MIQLPPCPICGKDDLFMGTDGKPGCPHCEVAVRLPECAAECGQLTEDGEICQLCRVGLHGEDA